MRFVSCVLCMYCDAFYVFVSLDTENVDVGAAVHHTFPS